MFKTVLRGFDKDEVLAYIQQLQDELNLTKTEKEKAVNEREKTIRDLREKITQKDEQRARLENEIETKYKKYVDNYDKIGRLVFESQMKSDNLLAESKAEAEQTLEESRKAAEKLLGEAKSKAAYIKKEAKDEAERVKGQANAEAAVIREQAEQEAAQEKGRALYEAESLKARAQVKVEEALEDGKAKYTRIQSVLEETLNLFGEIQRSFLVNYREVHHIVEKAGTTLAELEMVQNGESTNPALPGEPGEGGLETSGQEDETSSAMDEAGADETADEEWDGEDITEELLFPSSDEDYDLDDETDEVPVSYRRDSK